MSAVAPVMPHPRIVSTLAPVIRFAYTPGYLRDPDYPNEDFNAVWRDVMRYALADQTSPFINGQRATRILDKQLDLVKNGQKTAAAALTSAARQINDEIRQAVEADPSLRQRYASALRRARR